MKRSSRFGWLATLATAGALVTLAACASGQSILNAGNDATTTTAPAPPRRRPPPRVLPRRSTSWAARAVHRPRSTSSAAPPRRPRRRRSICSAVRAAGCAAPALRPTSTRARSTRSTSATGPVQITFWHAMTNVLEDAARRAHRRLQRQPGSSPSSSCRTRTATARRSTSTSSRAVSDRPEHRAVARVHGAADGRHRTR